MAPSPAFKQEAHNLVDQLPDNATWQDLIYRAAVRADIEAGLQDSAAGRVTRWKTCSRNSASAKRVGVI